MTAMMLVNISTDMPFPTPWSMISSPIHMITAVPDTIVITMVPMANGVGAPAAWGPNTSAAWCRGT